MREITSVSTEEVKDLSRVLVSASFGALGGSIISELLVYGISGLSQALKKKPIVRKWILIISSLVLMISLFFIIYNVLNWGSNDVIIGFFALLFIVSMFFVLTCVISFIARDKKTIDEVLEDLKEERIILENKSDDEINVLDIVRINLNQLNEYYVINKLQAKSSYRLSMFTISIGFILIIVAISYGFFMGKVEALSIIGTTAGFVAEFIGATSLLLYKESNKNVSNFYTQLIYLQNMMLAIEITKSLPDIDRHNQLGNVINALINNKYSNTAEK